MSQFYSVYEINGGRIVRYGENPDHDLIEEHLEEGQALLRGEALDDRLWIVIDGAKVALIPTVDLVALEKELLAQIDNGAEGVRSLFITNTASQPAVYMAKEAEALALMANPEISEAETPNLTREAARLNDTRFNCAWVIIAMAEGWRQMSAVIEDRRLEAKDLVREAADEAGKRAAAQVDWSDLEDQA